MSSIIKHDDTTFAAFNAADESQIIDSEKYLISGEWLYKTHGDQYSISYDGIRAFAKWLAKHGIIVQTISSEITESGDAQSLKYKAKVQVKDAVTGVVFEGISSQMQYGEKKDGSTYWDSTAETKAHSKAERNAIRKHVPADLITKFIEEVKKTGKIKTLKVESEQETKPHNNTNQDNPPSEKQLEYLKNLGYTGIPPKSKGEASKIIERCKNKSDSKYCTCASPIPNGVTNGKTCQSCLKLLEVNS